MITNVLPLFSNHIVQLGEWLRSGVTLVGQSTTRGSHAPSSHILSKLVTVQSTRGTRSSSVATISRPPTSSSLKITNRSFQQAAPRLWNKLPHFFHEPHPHPGLSPSHYPTQVGSTLSSPPLSTFNWSTGLFVWQLKAGLKHAYN